jgi:NADH-quinone oxidoreductase subunit J
VVIALEMSFLLTRGFDLPTAKPMPPEVAQVANTKALGIDLYTNYLFPVQVAAVILLVGIIAAIALTLRQRKDSRSQNVGEQVRVKKADRLRVVKVAPQVEAPAAQPDQGGQA